MLLLLLNFTTVMKTQSTYLALKFAVVFQPGVLDPQIMHAILFVAEYGVPWESRYVTVVS